MYQYIPQKTGPIDWLFPWLKVGRTVNMGIRATTAAINKDYEQAGEYGKAAGEAYLHSIPGMIVVGSSLGSKALGSVLAGLVTSPFKMTPILAARTLSVGKGATTVFRAVGKTWVWPLKKSLSIASRATGRAVSTYWNAWVMTNPAVQSAISWVSGAWSAIGSLGVKAVGMIKHIPVIIKSAAVKGATAVVSATKAAYAVGKTLVLGLAGKAAPTFAYIGAKVSAAGSAIASGLSAIPVWGWVAAGVVLLATAITIGVVAHNKKHQTDTKSILDPRTNDSSRGMGTPSFA